MLCPPRGCQQATAGLVTLYIKTNTSSTLSLLSLTHFLRLSEAGFDYPPSVISRVSLPEQLTLIARCLTTDKFE